MPSWVEYRLDKNKYIASNFLSISWRHRQSSIVTIAYLIPYIERQYDTPF
jgi:hypothetical protein